MLRNMWQDAQHMHLKRCLNTVSGLQRMDGPKNNASHQLSGELRLPCFYGLAHQQCSRAAQLHESLLVAQSVAAQLHAASG